SAEMQEGFLCLRPFCSRTCPRFSIEQRRKVKGFVPTGYADLCSAYSIFPLHFRPKCNSPDGSGHGADPSLAE
ncbi:hypothetical protein, partial [Pedobacter sp. SG918]|uniref:hypothetical protein n=1 Tax=Pedobacter sp. SG918 TaxID=2587136 RepID=UPI001B7D61EC